jgi:hypothetical protein
MRVASLVPLKADDIRDASPDTFGDIQARRARSSGELVAAAIFFSFAAVLVVLAAIQLVAQYRVRTPGAAKRLARGSVLGGCISAIRGVMSEVEQNGWTPDLVGRALSLCRIAAAIALGAQVSQTVVGAGVDGREGQLVVPTGILRRKRMLISSATTTDALTGALRAADGTPNARTQSILVDLRDSMRLFTAARYGAAGQLDRTALDGALDKAADAMRRLRPFTLWPMRIVGGLPKPVPETGETMWSR